MTKQKYYMFDNFYDFKQKDKKNRKRITLWIFGYPCQLS